MLNAYFDSYLYSYFYYFLLIYVDMFADDGEYSDAFDYLTAVKLAYYS